MYDKINTLQTQAKEGMGWTTTKRGLKHYRLKRKKEIAPINGIKNERRHET